MMPGYVHAPLPNVIVVVHGGGQPDDALPLIKTQRPLCLQALRNYDSSLLLHDCRFLESATEAYARPFGEFAKELGDEKFKHVVLVPKAIVRIVAMFAIRLSGINATVVKNEAKAIEAMAEFADNPAVFLEVSQPL